MNEEVAIAITLTLSQREMGDNVSAKIGNERGVGGGGGGVEGGGGGKEGMAEGM